MHNSLLETNIDKSSANTIINKTNVTILSYDDPNCLYCHYYVSDADCTCHMFEKNVIVRSYNDPSCQYCHGYVSDADCTCPTVDSYDDSEKKVPLQPSILSEEMLVEMIKASVVDPYEYNDRRRDCLYCHHYVSDADCTC